MRKKLWLAVLIGILLLVGGLYFWFTVWTGTAISLQVTRSKEAVLSQAFSCPAESAEVSRPASKDGWMRFCERNGARHGPYIAAASGHLSIRGQYRSGKEDGLWEWFDSEGRLYRRMVYEEGKVIGQEDQTIDL